MEVAHRAAESGLLFELASELGSLLGLDQLEGFAGRAALRICAGAAMAHLCLVEEGATHDHSLDRHEDGRAGACWLCPWLRDQALTVGETVYHADLARCAQGAGRPGVAYGSAMAAPLAVGGRPVGALIVASHEEDGFDDSERHLWTTLASQVAVAVENARLYDELRRQKQHMEAVIKHMADGLLVLDRDRRVTSMNPAAGRMLGLHESEVVGWSPSDGVRDARFEPLARICRTEEPAGQGIRHPDLLDDDKPGGPPEVVVDIPEPRVLRVLSSPIEALADGEGGEIKVLHDVTRERELEQMQRDFVSTVSHELRTPLFSIKGFVELILKGQVADPAIQQEFLARVLDQANHLSVIVSDLLDTSRLEAGSVDLDKTRLDLAQVVRDAVLKLEGVARERGLTLDVQGVPDLPMVLVDGRRLAQVVTNLVGNAIKFSPPGGSVQVRCFADSREITVQVVDQGIGIPPEAVPRLFSKFYQVDASATRRVGGTGLGLYISRRIVEAHGGRIGAKSIVGQGSTFSFTIPVTPEEG